MPLLDHRQDLLETRSVEVLPRSARFLDDGDRSQIMEFGVGTQLVGLTVDREPFGGLLLG
ncbi:MAG: hypothetical protein WD184_07315 [Acidimicrobiia bacterium]